MTEPPSRDDDPEKIARYSWVRLRRAALRKQRNEGAKSWDDIHPDQFAAGIEKAMRKWAAQ